MLDVDELLDTLDRRVREGYLYGDFQFATDPQSRGFLRTGVLSCYRPMDRVRPVPRDQRRALAE